MWGTTNLNLFLLEERGGVVEVIDKRHGPGASRVSKIEFERTLFELAGDWLSLDVRKTIILAGMVGSTIGWIEAGYTTCPTSAEDIQFATVQTALGYEIHIVSGLTCTNPRGDVDVIRGEETELIGLLALQPELAKDEHLVCIPGTHAKWVKLRDGNVVDFVTSVAGELFAGLRTNGVLIEPGRIEESAVDSDFLAGAKLSAQSPELLVHSLFGVRARQVAGIDSRNAALQRLSGLIIGSDVAAALKTYSQPETPILVIGNDQTASRYAAAIRQHNIDAQTIDGQTASALGLWRLSLSTMMQKAIK